MNPVFHLSLPCANMEATKKFYVDDLEFKHGRNSSQWLDVDLFNHQITFVLSEKFKIRTPNYMLENTILPLFHFGIILDESSWEEMYDKVNHWTLDITPKKTFFKDKNGEHHSFFIQDPNDYTLEFKTFIDSNSIFLF
jgi:extradiol dioxygenase family protein